MPLVTFDDRNVGDIFGINEFYEETSVTSNATATQTRNFTVSGDGLVYCSISMRTDGTSDMGSLQVYVAKNDTVEAIDGWRLTTATGLSMASSCGTFTQVQGGDKLTLYGTCSKNGKKSFIWHILCLGCSVTEQV